MCTTIEDRLKYLRKSVGLSQKLFADKVGLSFRTVQIYEKDASSLTIVTAQNIASSCNINSEWLINGSGVMINGLEKDTPQNEDRINIDSIVEEHMDFFNKFRNQERAKRLCEKMLMLESISENQLDKIEQDIDKRIEIAEDVVAEIKKTESIMDQNESDRREKSINWTSEERRKKAAS